MALTTEKREALRYAREMIESGQEMYICFALYSVKRKHPRLAGACQVLRDYIEIQLGHCGPLESWQRKNGFGERCGYQSLFDRLAWIDWMLDEPKEEC
ncbi:hypothetical protein WS62_23365 [Burkholderia sp. ABCPW 14]|uniref:hypothetical protein n=1 Tax=Burkholderia sp. ABCPW 14 TaxID=1637860 RepID=UPI000770E482|nr:hypothetical protein [Burkholderia sp. ABCPW 14]KVD81899.1 hypothetical protein WS62_23365 [Burkholderia sp. ABCPW 14]